MSNDYINTNEKNKEISGGNGATHPIWQGVGCVMLTIIPILGYLLTLFSIEKNVFIQDLLSENYFFSRSVDLMEWDKYIIKLIPASKLFFYNMRDFLDIKPIPYFWGALLIGLILSSLMFTIISFGFAIYKKSTGLDSYGPHDVKPKDVKPKGYKKRKTKLK